MRGHVLAEVRAIESAKRAVAGAGYDGVLFAPAYFDAGRETAGDVHRTRVGNALVPVGQTEFASDATFGYRSSALKEFLGEKSGGRLSPDDVLSIALEDIRGRNPAMVNASNWSTSTCAASTSLCPPRRWRSRSRSG